jgi:hypothetical protein
VLLPDGCVPHISASVDQECHVVAVATISGCTGSADLAQKLLCKGGFGWYLALFMGPG